MMLYRWVRGLNFTIFALCLLFLALAVACGGAAQAPAPPKAPEAAAPPAAKAPEAAAPPAAKAPEAAAPPAAKAPEAAAPPAAKAPEAAAPTAVVAPKATPAAKPAVKASPTVTRYVESQGEIQMETNLHCAGIRPIVSQFRPYVELLVDADVRTGQFVPWLAEKWEMSPDAKSWTFHLRKGVPFHFNYGQFTAKDIVNIAQAKGQKDCLSSTAGFWRRLDRAEIINDHQLTFHMKNQALTMVDIVSSTPTGGELFGLSKAQLDEVGPANMDKVKPAGTSYYQYMERKLGQSVVYERVPYEHWRARAPFKEFEIKWIAEDSTRLAGLLAGELHAIALSRDLQGQAVKAGMKIISAQLPFTQLSLLLGGMYFTPGDADFDPTTPWVDKRVRQAMNMALNRDELNKFILGGQGEIQYVTACCHPVLAPEVHNPKWVADWKDLYGYNPEKAKQLLREAGYGPNNPVKVTAYNYRTAGEPESNLIVEALPQYWDPVGFKVTLQDIDTGAVTKLWRTKKLQHGIWPNVFSFRPIQERVRGMTTQGTSSHMFDHPFVDQKYEEMLKTSSQEEVDRIGREVADYWFYNIQNVPLFWFKFNMTVNPKIIEDWTFLNRGQYWHLQKPATK